MSDETPNVVHHRKVTDHLKRLNKASKAIHEAAHIVALEQARLESQAKAPAKEEP